MALLQPPSPLTMVALMESRRSIVRGALSLRIAMRFGECNLSGLLRLTTESSTWMTITSKQLLGVPVVTMFGLWREQPKFLMKTMAR